MRLERGAASAGSARPVSVVVSTSLKQRKPAAFQPADRRRAVGAPSSRRAASRVERHGNAAPPRPVEDIVIGSGQRRRSGTNRQAAQVPPAGARPSSMPADFVEAEERQVPAGGEEGALAVRMGDADRQRRADVFDRPAAGPLAKASFSQVPNWSLPVLAAIAIVDANADPRPTRAVAGTTADAQLVMVDDDFRPGLRPGAAGPRIRSTLTLPMTTSGRTHSLRVILVDADRRAGIGDARLGKGDHEATAPPAASAKIAAMPAAGWRRKGVVTPGTGASPEASKTTTGEPASAAETAMALTRPAVASAARNRTTPT